MGKRSAFIYIVIVLVALTNLSYQKFIQENHPPTIKIITPLANASVQSGMSLNYRLSVSDKEDGDSQFDEINTKEVLLEVKYLGSKSASTTATVKTAQDDAPGLGVIRTSNCLNCHGFNSKSIGPSFFEISKRYPATRANTDTLIRNIKNGSANIWGKEKMPSHPELTIDEIKSTVLWILKNSASQNTSYYNGTTGIIQFPAKKGSYLLTASYVDHGLNGGLGKRLKGVNMVMVSVK